MLTATPWGRGSPESTRLRGVLPRTPRRDRLQRRGPLPGSRPGAAQRARPRAGRAARRARLDEGLRRAVVQPARPCPRDRRHRRRADRARPDRGRAPGRDRHRRLDRPLVRVRRAPRTRRASPRSSAPIPTSRYPGGESLRHQTVRVLDALDDDRAAARSPCWSSSTRWRSASRWPRSAIRSRRSPTPRS